MSMYMYSHTWKYHDMKAKMRGQLREALLSFYNLDPGSDL